MAVEPGIPVINVSPARRREINRRPPGKWDVSLSRVVGLLFALLLVCGLAVLLAGVPWYFDEGLKSYRVRSGYKFPLIDSGPAVSRVGEAELLPRHVELTLRKLLADGEAFQASLERFLAQVKAASRGK